VQKVKTSGNGKGPNCANEEKRVKSHTDLLVAIFEQVTQANILGCLFISFGKAKEHARFFEVH